jgi:DNA repair exonuclease SbcCD ATPase subunit
VVHSNAPAQNVRVSTTQVVGFGAALAAFFFGLNRTINGYGDERGMGIAAMFAGALGALGSMFLGNGTSSARSTERVVSKGDRKVAKDVGNNADPSVAELKAIVATLGAQLSQTEQRLVELETQNSSPRTETPASNISGDSRNEIEVQLAALATRAEELKLGDLTGRIQELSSQLDRIDLSKMDQELSAVEAAIQKASATSAALGSLQTQAKSITDAQPRFDKAQAKLQELQARLRGLTPFSDGVESFTSLVAEAERAIGEVAASRQAGASQVEALTGLFAALKAEAETKLAQNQVQSEGLSEATQKYHEIAAQLASTTSVSLPDFGGLANEILAAIGGLDSGAGATALEEQYRNLLSTVLERAEAAQAKNPVIQEAESTLQRLKDMLDGAGESNLDLGMLKALEHQIQTAIGAIPAKESYANELAELTTQHQDLLTQAQNKAADARAAIDSQLSSASTQLEQLRALVDAPTPQIELPNFVELKADISAALQVDSSAVDALTDSVQTLLTGAQRKGEQDRASLRATVEQAQARFVELQETVAKDVELPSAPNMAQALERARTSLTVDQSAFTQLEQDVVTQLNLAQQKGQSASDALANMLNDARGKLAELEALVANADPSIKTTGFDKQIQQAQAAIEAMQTAHDTALAGLTQQVSAITSKAEDKKKAWETTLAELGTQVAGLEQSFEAAGKREVNIDALKQEIQRLQEQLKVGLPGADNKAKQAVSALTTRLQEVQKGVKNIENQQADRDREIARHGTTVAQLETQQSRLTDDVAQKFGESSPLMLQLSQKITNTRTGLDGVKEKAAALQRTLDDLDRRIDAFASLAPNWEAAQRRLAALGRELDEAQKAVGSGDSVQLLLGRISEMRTKLQEKVTRVEAAREEDVKEVSALHVQLIRQTGPERLPSSLPGSVAWANDAAKLLSNSFDSVRVDLKMMKAKEGLDQDPWESATFMVRTVEDAATQLKEVQALARMSPGVREALGRSIDALRQEVGTESGELSRGVASLQSAFAQLRRIAPGDQQHTSALSKEEAPDARYGTYLGALLTAWDASRKDAPLAGAATWRKSVSAEKFEDLAFLKASLEALSPEGQSAFYTELMATLQDSKAPAIHPDYRYLFQRPSRSDQGYDHFVEDMMTLLLHDVSKPANLGMPRTGVLGEVATAAAVNPEVFPRVQADLGDASDVDRGLLGLLTWRLMDRPRRLLVLQQTEAQLREARTGAIDVLVASVQSSNFSTGDYRTLCKMAAGLCRSAAAYGKPRGDEHAQHLIDVHTPAVLAQALNVSSHRASYPDTLKQELQTLNADAYAELAQTLSGLPWDRSDFNAGHAEALIEANLLQPLRDRRLGSGFGAQEEAQGLQNSFGPESAQRRLLDRVDPTEATTYLREQVVLLEAVRDKIGPNERLSDFHLTHYVNLYDEDSRSSGRATNDPSSTFESVMMPTYRPPRPAPQETA